ncbi:hypothetical protein PIB30_042325 [Stylosanthes scabra]|uniref:Uncharacterized protein n=1 Tax=Stylosanthes scabra TaxID=79078 RepID=A0ABU6QEM6_9FABA|nr:hypothetical protein [Stylosanthes scabra]
MRTHHSLGRHAQMLDSALMRTHMKLPCAEFGAEVAEESERNERIATKPRRPLLDQMRMQQ